MADAEPETNHQVNADGDRRKDHLIELMQRKLSQSPRLLSRAAGKSTCSIFRAPQSMIDSNGQCYQPRIVSIGPYHRGQPHLRMIDEHKWRYLKNLLNRTSLSKGLNLEDYLDAVEKLEEEARGCYSEAIRMDSDEFNEMMVLDGCFIVELFRKVGKLVQFEPDDPIISMAWILPFFYRDFLKLENQIPYFILESLFDLTREDDERSRVSSPNLASLAFAFFNHVMHRSDEVLDGISDLRGKHLLDLVRKSLIPSSDREATPQRHPMPSHIIHSISKLRRAGIKLRPPKTAESFLVVSFRTNGVIEMPTITVDDFLSSFLQNCVAYEQCHGGCSKHFTTYATLLDCLINTYRDVEYLIDQNIIENYFGTDQEIASFVNNLGKDVAFDIDLCYLNRLFNDIHEYYLSSWHVQWASFKYTYFSSPWSFISALAALFLLILSVAQTLYTIYPFYKK